MVTSISNASDVPRNGPSATSFSNIMKDIITLSQSYLVGHEQDQPLASPSPPPLVCLPEPPPFYDALISAGAPRRVAVELDNVYKHRALALRERSSAAISQACSKIANLRHHSGTPIDELLQNIITSFSSLYTKRMNEWVEEGLALVRSRRVAFSNDAFKATCGKRPKPFNHEYIPMLEHFFDENPFPTHADKEFLAKKSGMTYRQIHVWFQNRRNRVKKDGRILRKKPMAEGVSLPLDKLYSRMSKYIIAARPRSASQDSSSSLDVTGPNADKGLPVIAQSQDNVLDLVSAPPHAFPTSFPPNCLYDPFPEQDAFTSWKSLPWFRRSCSTFVVSQSHVDVDELIERFSQLSVRGHSYGSPATRCYSASTSITVIPSVAPHPAFIRQGAHYKRPAVIPFPCVSASPSARRLVFSSSSQSWSVIAAPSCTGERSVGLVRKVAPLPRRSLRTFYGNEISRITSNSLTPPPSASGSRSVSCSSDQCLQTHLDVHSRSSSPRMPVLSRVPQNLANGAPFNHLPPASSCLLPCSNWISIPTDRITNLVSPPQLIPQCS